MGWYSPNWKFRKKITVDYTKVSAAQTNFPIYVDLSSLGSNFFAHMKSGGADIRITQSDGTTEQCIELVSVTTSTGSLFFKASSISSTVNTAFYIYYGNSAASAYADSDTYGKYNVWTSAAVAVYHMEQDPSGGAPQILDSTTNQRNLTSAGTMTSGDLIDAKILKGIDFDGSDDSLSVSAADLSINNNFTFQFWMKPAVIGHGAGIYTNSGSTTANRIFCQFYNNVSYVRRINVSLYNSGNTAYVVDFLSTMQFAINTWYMFTATFNGSTLIFYQNGNGVIESKAATAGQYSINTNRNIFWCPIATKYTGIIDEFRLYNEAKSASWILTNYNNENSPSTFYAIGPEENRFIPRMIII
jgi:hypothetical protein